MAVHNHVAGAVLAAQQLVVGLLDSRLAHHVAGLVGRIALLVKIVLAHLAHVPDQVGGEAIPGIKPPLLVDGLQLRQLIAMRLDKCLLVGGDVLLDGNGLVTGRGPIAAQRGAQIFHIQVQAVGDERQVGVNVAALLMNQKAGDRGVVVHHQPVLAVEQLAARGQHRNFANAVLLGGKAVVVRSQHLQPPQPPHQGQHDQKNAPLHHRQLQRGELFVAIDHAGEYQPAHILVP